MKTHVQFLIVSLLAMAALTPGARLAAGEAANAPVRLAGKVLVTQRDGNVPSTATFTVNGGQLYNLTMDGKGRSLAGVMHGETAEIVVTVLDKDGAKWLKVLDYADPTVTAGHEFWRRMRCNACVVLPALRNAATPADLHGAVPVAGRDYSFKRKFTAWTSDGKFLWAADDSQLFQIDLAAQSVVRAFGKPDGLPDGLVYQLLGDGQTLWIVHRAGVAALSSGANRIAELPRIRAKYARLFADAFRLWVVADSGTFRLKTPGDEIVAGPPVPTAARMATAVDNGIWTPHWGRRTAPFASSGASAGGKLYVCSWGDVYEYDGVKWTKIAGGYELRAQAGKLWFIDAKGLVEYDPATGQCTPYQPPEECRGRYAGLVVTETAAWLWAEPQPSAGAGETPALRAAGAPSAGGGLGRFDFAARRWQTWPEINGQKAQHVSGVTVQDGSVWATTMAGHYISKSAHPGMTTTTRQSFEATSFCLNRFDEKGNKWDSYQLALADLGSRLICGQDGNRGMDTIVPQYVDELSVGAKRIFAISRLAPKQYFGGYWPCIEQLAVRANDKSPWSAKFEHHPDELELQGEQPLVLNISNGELTRIGSNLKDQLWEAVGHDLVLGLFFHAGRHWAVTEGCIGCLDEDAGTWRKVIEPDFRWYWRATAALDDGRFVYLGSDRGLVCRMDVEEGRFEYLGALKDRAITRIARGQAGEICFAAQPAPLGVWPVQLSAKLKPLDADAARFDGKTFVAAKPDENPSAEAKPPWSFRYFDRKDHLDKSQGNYLCGPGSDSGEIKPRYYVKEVFYPLFLCAGNDGRRLWISTYTGIVRLDVR